MGKPLAIEFNCGECGTRKLVTSNEYDEQEYLYSTKCDHCGSIIRIVLHPGPYLKKLNEQLHQP